MNHKPNSSKMPAVPGYKAAGISCGIKPDSIKDLALVYSETPAFAAGVFTKNRVRSPSVVWSQKALNRAATFRAVLTNSGNANACVGVQGMDDCRTVVSGLARELAISPKEILFASTGIIGVPLPKEKIVEGLPGLVQKLSAKGWKNMARAILTTDLVAKTSVLDYNQGKSAIVLGGTAKGSGMIHPNMATMLGFIYSNAAVEPATLRQALKEANDRSFNCITVDGDTSTNDCVFLMANGQAGNKPIQCGSREYVRFLEALTEVSKDLSTQIVKDGEGATKFVTIRVQGAKSRKHAHKVAQTVAQSSLVKTALFGEDPNWGRILAAVGYSGVPIKEDRTDITLNGAALYTDGSPAAGASQTALRKLMKKKSIVIGIDLNAGDQRAEVFTCDLSYDYVRINAEYTT